MPETTALEQFVRDGSVEASVFAVRPDYRAMLVAVDGIAPGGSDAYGEKLLRAAEASARPRCSSSMPWTP